MEQRTRCGTDRRRRMVADAAVDMGGGVLLNGIDFIEVLDRDAPDPALRQRLIDVAFIRPDGAVGAGPLLGPENFRISGGVRVVGITVQDVAKAGPRTLRLTLDRAGDFSVYALSLTAGAAIDAPPANMDLALSRVAFSFKADCPAEYDCKPAPGAPPADAPGPALNYLARDYDTFRRLMLDRMAETIPAWTERSPADLGVTLVEALAFAADQTSYFQDAIATEAYLPLARLRSSVLRHARLLGHRAAEGANARTVVALTAAADRSGPGLIPAGTRLLTAPPDFAGRLPAIIPPEPELMERALAAGALSFETMEDVTDLRVARNEMRLHDWGDPDCRLPAGTTVAHAVGTAAALGLSRGDLIAFEERIPPGGSADDPPDPARRQVVRLSADPAQLRDALLDVDVLELRWAVGDALEFAVNLSGGDGAPGAALIGNLVLADHGRSVDFRDPRPEDAIAAPRRPGTTAPLRTGLLDAQAPGAAPRPRLDADAVVFAAPFDPRAARDAPLRAALFPSEAPTAQVRLIGDGETWTARPDLLASDRYAPDFKVEPTSDGGARVLFGDGELGKAPDPDADFTAVIRMGGGPAGNVGPDAIRHMVLADQGLLVAVRNLIPATGGRARDADAAIKIAAPRAFRVQKRAVTPADYAQAAESHPEVSRAAADLRWTGSWRTVFLSIDRVGGRPAQDPAFQADLRRLLGARRLAGHDLEIVEPRRAPLDIVLVACAEDGFYGQDVARDLADAFSAGMARDGRRGFFHPDAFSFGDPVRLSAMIARAMQVPGVRWVGTRLGDDLPPGRFARMDQPGVDHADAGEIPIGPREVAEAANDPDAPDRGRVRFAVEGGR